MVREERAYADQRMTEHGRANLVAQMHLQRWFDHIQSVLPEGGSLVANVQEAEEKGFLVSFRAETENETFISEARNHEPVKAVEEAATCLFQRISGLVDEHPRFPRRLRDLFSEAS